MAKDDRLFREIEQIERDRNERLRAEAMEAARRTPAGRREEAQQRREALAAHQEARQNEAEERTAAAERRAAELDGVLRAGLDVPPVIDFDSAKRTGRRAAFNPPDDLAVAESPPSWAAFAPPARGWWARNVKRDEAGEAEAQRDARSRFDAEVAAHRRREEHRVAVLHEAREHHEREQDRLVADVDAHNASIEASKRAFAAGEQTPVEEGLNQALGARPLPAGIPRQVEVGFRPETGQVLVLRELPGTDVVPGSRAFRYVKTRDSIESMAVKPKELNERYAGVLAQLSLLTLHDVFVTAPADLVLEVTVSGMIDAVDPGTGRTERQCLISVSATRDEFDGLVLREVSPLLCLHRLNALVSPNPWDVEPVRPLFEPDLSRFRTVDAQQVAARLDSRQVLVRLTPTEFEHLVRELFESMGMKSWVTQASRDDGVDAVAVNDDAVMGGLCVIQAKRYTNVVGADAVRALWGVMEDKKAGTGVLVTTSYFGKTTHEFAARNERVRLIEGPHLKHLIHEFLGADVLTGAKSPPDSQRWRNHG